MLNQQMRNTYEVVAKVIFRRAIEKGNNHKLRKSFREETGLQLSLEIIDRILLWWAFISGFSLFFFKVYFIHDSAWKRQKHPQQGLAMPWSPSLCPSTYQDLGHWQSVSQVEGTGVPNPKSATCPSTLSWQRYTYTLRNEAKYTLV